MNFVTYTILALYFNYTSTPQVLHSNKTVELDLDVADDRVSEIDKQREN